MPSPAISARLESASTRPRRRTGRGRSLMPVRRLRTGARGAANRQPQRGTVGRSPFPISRTARRVWREPKTADTACRTPSPSSLVDTRRATGSRQPSTRASPLSGAPRLRASARPSLSSATVYSVLSPPPPSSASVSCSRPSRFAYRIYGVEARRHLRIASGRHRRRCRDFPVLPDRFKLNSAFLSAAVTESGTFGTCSRFLSCRRAAVLPG